MSTLRYVVDEYLAAEIAQSHVAGPFKKLATPGHTSADLGLSPRSTQKVETDSRPFTPCWL